MNFKFISLILIAAIAGCAGAPPTVSASSASSITINYSPETNNMGDVQAIAQKHCTRYKKDAVPRGTYTDQTMQHIEYRQEQAFECVKRN